MEVGWHGNFQPWKEVPFFYVIKLAIGLVILYVTLPETKNMSIEEIQLAIKKK